MTRVEEPYDDSVCRGCKHLKSKTKKNCFGETEWNWYCTVNQKTHNIMGCRGFMYRD